MRNLIGALVLLLLLSFGLPSLLAAINSLIIPAIIVVSLLAVGSVVFGKYNHKRRRW